HRHGRHGHLHRRQQHGGQFDDHHRHLERRDEVDRHEHRQCRRACEDQRPSARLIAISGRRAGDTTMDFQEARSRWAADRARHESLGLFAWPTVWRYRTDAEKRDWHAFDGAMDAQPTLATDPASSIPAILTTTIDPDVYRVIYSPLAFAKILGERKAGDWI